MWASSCAIERTRVSPDRVPDGSKRCSRLKSESYAFALDLLEQAGVAITPGIDFGSYRSGEHVRFAYTRPIAELEKGVQRIAAFLERGGRA